MHRKVLALSIIFCFISCLHANIRVNLKLKDYANMEDKKYDGKSCEIWFGDYCDPKFYICLGSAKGKCNIINESTKTYKNKKIIKEVFSGQKYSYLLQKHLYLRVRVYDVDSISNNDLIADYEEEFSFETVSQGYAGKFSSQYSAKLSYDIQMYCDSHYYGPVCGTKCISVRDNYSCDPTTGKKLCILNCKNSGFCMWAMKKYICVCSQGWGGQLCDESLISPTDKSQSSDAEIIMAKNANGNFNHNPNEINTEASKTVAQTQQQTLSTTVEVTSSTMQVLLTQQNHEEIDDFNFVGELSDHDNMEQTLESNTNPIAETTVTSETSDENPTDSSSFDDPTSSIEFNSTPNVELKTTASQTVSSTKTIVPHNRNNKYDPKSDQSSNESDEIMISKGKLLILLCLSSLALILVAILIVAVVWRLLFPNRQSHKHIINDEYFQKHEYSPAAAIWRNSFEDL